MKTLVCSTHFSHCKSMVFFPDSQKQLTPQTEICSDRNSNIQAFIAVLSTYKNVKDTIKNEGARSVTTLNIDLRHPMVANSIVGEGIWTNHKLIHAFIASMKKIYLKVKVL